MTHDFSATGAASAGEILAFTTRNGGHPPEFWTERCMEKLISISPKAPEPLRQQCLAYREDMKAVVLHYMRQAVQSDRATHEHQLREKILDTKG